MDKRSAIVTMLVGLVLGGILAVPSAYAAETEEKKPEPRLTNFKDWAQTDFAGRASVRVDDEGT